MEERSRRPPSEESKDEEVKLAHTKDVVPDGGWGWFVVFATFIGNVLTDGTIGTFGIFYPFITSAFRSSPALTSLTGSLIPAIYMMSAPVIGFLIQRFDCRRVSVVGGLVATLGLAFATLCEDIGEFAICYGVLGGIGIGMNSLCGHLMVNTYFSRKRGIANGIVSSGAGMGVFILTPLLQYLLENYTWRGTMLIYSGCVLQYCVCGMLMRPLHIHQTVDVSDTDSSTQGTASTESDQGLSQSEQPLLKPKTSGILNEHTQNMPKLFHSQEVGQRPVSIKKYFTSFFHVDNHNLQSLYRNSLPDLSKNRDDFHMFSSKNLDLNDFYTNKTRSLHRTAYVSMNLRSNSRYLNPLDRKDIFYSGSIFNLPEYQDVGSVEDFNSYMADVESMSTDDETGYSDLTVKKDVTWKKRLRNLTSRLIDLSVFRYNVYVPVLLGGIFIQMGQFIPLTFIPNYCYSIGLDSSDVTIIISVYGISNIIGRLSAGCLANFECISTLWLCTFGNFMCGVACALFPFCASLETLCLYAFGFGYFIGYFAPLQVLIMVEYMGINKLTSAFGIMQMCKGPAALFGPPLAGMVYQWTADYSTTLLVASVLFILSAVAQSTLPLIDRISNKSNPAKDDDV